MTEDIFTAWAQWLPVSIDWSWYIMFPSPSSTPSTHCPLITDLSSIVMFPTPVELQSPQLQVEEGEGLHLIKTKT